MKKINQYVILSLLIFLASCSHVNQPLSFNGTWSYSNQANDAVGGKVMVLEQVDDVVTGEWSEGISTGSIGSGKLKGHIKDGKLFLGYCSDAGTEYKACPEYEEEKSYFIIQNNRMIEYYLVSKGDRNIYKQGDEFILSK